jgi:hypothetical protein
MILQMCCKVILVQYVALAFEAGLCSGGVDAPNSCASADAQVELMNDASASKTTSTKAPTVCKEGPA